jgi:aldose 1-epimerase
MNPPLVLASRRFTVGLMPDLGGALLYFATTREPLVDFVRPTAARTLAERKVRGTSGYPMVPYSNRIGDGRFVFQGRDVALATNSDVSTHPLHGLGWLHPWEVAEATPQRAVLALSHVPAGPTDAEWPWSFEARQTFDLDDKRLSWSLALTNRDAQPMPAGFGMHPFFPKTPRTEVRFAADGVWRNDERMLPMSRTGVPAEWDFRNARPVAELAVDNCFAGWSHTADIAWPELGWCLALAADEMFGHLVVYTSPARDSIAIEPITHVNNAVNLAAQHADTGLVVLAPGATLTGGFTLTPYPLEKTDAP